MDIFRINFKTEKEKATEGKDHSLLVCFNIHLFIDKCKFIHGELS